MLRHVSCTLLLYSISKLFGILRAFPSINIANL